MTIGEAIRTALEVEHRVRDEFAKMARDQGDPKARAFFEVMAREEQGHVDYLEAALKRWETTGAVEDKAIGTRVARRDWVTAGQKVLRRAEQGARRPGPQEHLSAALELEHEVSALYRRLVGAVEDPRAQEMFRRFLEIEDGHTALVQAEMDYELNTGNFFDMREFTLDG
jgi:rubrerythrin